MCCLWSKWTIVLNFLFKRTNLCMICLITWVNLLFFFLTVILILNELTCIGSNKTSLLNDLYGCTQVEIDRTVVPCGNKGDKKERKKNYMQNCSSLVNLLNRMLKSKLLIARSHYDDVNQSYAGTSVN